MPIQRREVNRVAIRVYQCVDCGTKQLCHTNHTNRCWPICQGKCRNIVQADQFNKRRETITQTEHHYVEEYDGPPAEIHSVVK